jgi:hypothetical protein
MQDSQGVISSSLFVCLAGAKPHAFRIAPLGGLIMDGLRRLRRCEMAPAGVCVCAWGGGGDGR